MDLNRIVLKALILCSHTTCQDAYISSVVKNQTAF